MGAMRRYLLVTVSAAALSSGAMAADIPARMPVKAPPPVVVAPSWAGFYIGVNAGVAWNDAKFTALGQVGGLQPLAFPNGTTYWSPNEAGFTGGGQLGYNLQSGNFVYGVEADLNFVSNKASVTQATNIIVPSITSTTKLDWMGTVRGRLGVTLSPTLVYVTGGWAFAHFEDTVTVPGVVIPANVSKTRSGWTAGGGVEHMFARNWTAKIEALYADFGKWDGFITAAGATYRTQFEHQVLTVRGGLNYKW
jgi:outer membrane immunogenic protein